MELFDACCYVGRWPSEQLAFATVEGLLAEMDRLGIGRALVTHTLAWQNVPAVGNAHLMEEIAGHPLLEPCWVVMPGETETGGPTREVEALCETMAAQNVRAVRLCPRDHVYPLTDWMTGALLAALADRRYLVLLDLDQVVLPTGLFDVNPAGWRDVAWLCQAFPALSVVLTKVGYRALRVLPFLMQDCPNLFLDLSYFATHQGVEEITATFGAERLLFGTNQPLTDPGGALTRLLYAEITAGQREMIAHGNLERLLDRVSGVGHRPVQSPAEREPDRPQITITNSGPHSLQEREEEASEHKHADLAALVQAGRSLSESGLEIIDAHGHVGPYRNFYIPNPSADSIVRTMDRCGVALACLSSNMAIGPDWVTGNRLTAEAVAAYPERLIGHAVANPNEPERIRSELTYAFDELGLQGIKLHPDLHAHPIGGEGYQPAWEFAAERGCLVLSHTFHGSRYCAPTAFGPLAERYPQVPIILLHSGSMTAAFEGAIALARQHANLYLDLSGSYITGPWIARMVSEAGAERVIFSSDIPFIDLRYSLGRVVFAQLTLEEQKLVLGGNIRRLMGL